MQRFSLAALTVLVGLAIDFTFEPSTAVVIVLWLSIAVLVALVVITWAPVSNWIWKTIAAHVEPFLTQPSAAAPAVATPPVSSSPAATTAQQPSNTDISAALLELQDEAHASRELIEKAIQRGKFWGAQDGYPKLNKVWKAKRELISKVPQCQDVYTKAAAASRDIEEIATRRGLRFFAGSHVQQDDNLPGAVQALEELETSIGAALAALDGAQ